MPRAWNRNGDNSIAFAIGVSHHEMERLLEGGEVAAARRVVNRILDLLEGAGDARWVSEAYRQLDVAIQQGPSRQSSPLLLAANLRFKLCGERSWRATRFELGYWAGSCHHAATEHDAASYATERAQRGWELARNEGLPKEATELNLVGDLRTDCCVMQR